MKIKFTLLLLVLLPAFVWAQSVEITPGNVLPKMTTNQRNNLSSPKNGMLVFDTNTQSYWYRKSGIWTELSGGGGSGTYWSLSGMGNAIENSNSGGFWSSDPVGLNNNSNDISNPPTAPISGDGTRLMWIPSRSAFRVVTIDGSMAGDPEKIGLYSFASGYNTEASGKNSVAFGYYNSATGDASFVMGFGSESKGNSSFAMGTQTIASGHNSFAMGAQAKASSPHSFAFGEYAEANNDNAIAIGPETRANGEASVALGDKTKAAGNSSIAIGYNTEASGYNSTAMGNQAKASGSYSTAMGGVTEASGELSTTMGVLTKASGYASTAMGELTKASGHYSTAMGWSSKASGNTSTAMGLETEASGDYSTAMGWDTEASGKGSIAMGYNTTASGDYSTAMGENSKAFAKNSFTLGKYIQLNSGATGSIYLADAYEDRNTVRSQNAINHFYARFDNGYTFYTDGLTNTSAKLAHGASSWGTPSDSTLKENFIAANTEEVLNSVSQMRIGTWNYKGQDPGTFRHWGVMAQDFFKHFGKDEYGTIGDDKTIATADFDGVAFAAIKGLEQRTRELKEALRQAQGDRETLENRVIELMNENQKLKENQSYLSSEISLIKQQLGLNASEVRASEE